MVQQPGQLSPDGRWVWNGAQWVPNAPIGAPYAVPWARPYESARGRATLSTVSLVAAMLGLAIGVGFDSLEIAFGGKSPADDTQTILAGLAALAFLIVYLTSYVSAIVFFCMWLHRVVRNMPALGAWDPRWSPAGAVGRCFIPFLNLVHPMYGTLDAWRGSDSSRRWINVGERKAMPAPALIVLWWALWLIGNWVGAIGGRLSNSDDAGTAVAGFFVNAFGFLLIICAGFLAINVVRDVTARQDLKNALLMSGQLA